MYANSGTATKSAAVVGLGYVGLPLAVQAARKGYDVIGIDLDQRLVSQINKHKSPFEDDELFARTFESLPPDHFKASSSYDELHDVSTIAICVPTPTENDNPDMHFVIEASRQVGRRLKPGQLVSLESTVNPGATREVVLPILERESNLQAGKDFHLAHCPERIDPGNKQLYVGNINRVVGGITGESTDRAKEFYESIVDAKIQPLASVEEAEFVKSWENSHRNVMIAMANTAAIICDALGMNIDDVLKGMQSKVDQFGLQLARPGIGPGGHCIPEDIHYVIKSARRNGVDTGLLDAATHLNERMPRYAAGLLSDMVHANGESVAHLKVSLLGLAYKPNTADMRHSPSIELGYQLIRQTPSVAIHDPHVERAADDIDLITGTTLVTSLDEALDYADAIVLGTAHDEYVGQLTPDRLRRSGIRYVLDGRNCLDGQAIAAAGIKYKGIGR